MSTVAAAALYACRTGDVPPGEGRAITLDGRRIAIFRAAGGWYALDAACPHRGGPLGDGIICDRAVICPLHERRFDLRTGAAMTTGDGVAAHRVEVRGERVFVTLAARARDAS
ncbi:MAG TPA: Rieske 2Fe-2S domain-containing protein [Solirubrobacteraceae bacterium]|nr:Rieske 2Fe-2S domain-containing protein [Solirubrobacteraceae bacterium]